MHDEGKVVFGGVQLHQQVIVAGWHPGPVRVGVGAQAGCFGSGQVAAYGQVGLTGHGIGGQLQPSVGCLPADEAVEQAGLLHVGRVAGHYCFTRSQRGRHTGQPLP